MRYFLVLTACLVVVGLAAQPLPASAQVGYDRPGGDYSNFSIPTGDPARCASQCERDGRCKAWSFSYPMTATNAATCWLKSEVTARVEAGCCVSGVRGAGVVEPKTGPIEFSIDRWGGDYRNIELPPDPTGNACKAACEGENRCRAWTYRRPGYGSSVARCYLKNQIKLPRKRPCCISGVVR